MSNPWSSAATTDSGTPPTAEPSNPPVDEWAPAEVLPDPAPTAHGQGPVYGSVYEWVEKWLVRAYRREMRTQHRAWCAVWWLHQEAVVRLSSLWEAWEELYQGGGVGPSEWWVAHADPHLRELTDPSGPFDGCTPDKHTDRAVPPLAVVPYTGPVPEGTGAHS